ncbi:MAG TPA: hypothetical protein VFH47_01520, partial [Candidatus Thermoplasmatota archaeon]|nr:hypothetical protein [Candidatus Thermoplasmatota archaeon]
MHMRQLRLLLGDLFQAHGYTVTYDVSLEGRSGTVFTAPVLCEGPRIVLVECVGEEPVEAALVEDLGTVCEDMGADLFVLAHVGPREAGAGAGVRNVVLWGRDRLVRELGQWKLAQATGIGVPPPHLEPEASLDEVAPLAEAEGLLAAETGTQALQEAAGLDDAGSGDDPLAGLDGLLAPHACDHADAGAPTIGWDEAGATESDAWMPLPHEALQPAPAPGPVRSRWEPHLAAVAPAAPPGHAPPPADGRPGPAHAAPQPPG